MSDILNKPTGRFDVEREVTILVAGASRWQEVDNHKDLMDVISAFNYLEAVKRNPTKNQNEALEALYKIIDHTNHFTISEEDPEVFDKLENILVGVEKKLPSVVDHSLVRRQMSSLQNEGDKEKTAMNLVLIYSNDMKKSVLLEIPSRPEN